MASKKWGGFALRTVKGRGSERDFTQLIDKDTGTPVQGVTELRVMPLSDAPDNNQVLITMVVTNLPAEGVDLNETVPKPEEGAGRDRKDATT